MTGVFAHSAHEIWLYGHGLDNMRHFGLPLGNLCNDPVCGSVDIDGY